MAVATLNLRRFVSTSDEFYELCQENPDLELERTASGEVIIMSPAGGETGASNLSIGARLYNWNEEHELGIAFDSSTGFTLPNGAGRSPDAAWIAIERWNRLSAEQKQKFPPLAPDFVIELRSSSDRMQILRDKMEEYINNGVRLGWLIDSQSRTVEIYEPGEAVETLYNPDFVAGDPVLPGFVLNMKKVWG
ncbi:MAG TPA: Uma2 family endonuclease [Caldilineaceae bacterium]|nr:Uma2 family endonuclease [Caldilineaceae bacterium]